jgi:hypothetical protein
MTSPSESIQKPSSSSPATAAVAKAGVGTYAGHGELSAAARSLTGFDGRALRTARHVADPIEPLHNRARIARAVENTARAAQRSAERHRAVRRSRRQRAHSSPELLGSLRSASGLIPRSYGSTQLIAHSSIPSRRRTSPQSRHPTASIISGGRGGLSSPVRRVAVRHVCQITKA